MKKKAVSATASFEIRPSPTAFSMVKERFLPIRSAICQLITSADLLEYMETGLMDEPTYLRAVDTKKQDLKQLDPTEYIEPDDAYETAGIWKH